MVVVDQAFLPEMLRYHRASGVAGLAGVPAVIPN